jgi:choline dehydrogenase-like flavoprotein
MNVAAAELLAAAGAKNIEPSTSGPSTPGGTNHEMGTARMGRDPKTSVLNGWCHYAVERLKRGAL